VASHATGSLTLDRISLSPLAAGCWRLAKQSAGQLTSVRSFIESSLSLGITTFDHADIYGGGEAEKLFGAALGQQPSLREHIQLVTKCGISTIKTHGKESLHLNTSKNHIISRVDSSLRALQTDYLDVLLLHRPDYLTPVEEVAEAFSDLRSLGKVRAFGVSNFSTWQYDELQSVLPSKLVTNQIELSVAKHAALVDGRLAHSRKNGFAVMAWSPLSGGALLRGSTANLQDLHSAMRRIASRYDVALATVAIAWLLQLPYRIVPILGTLDPEKLKQGAAAVKLKMDRTDWYAILAAAGTQFA